jgi:hypothetical protein
MKFKIRNSFLCFLWMIGSASWLFAQSESDYKNFEKARVDAKEILASEIKPVIAVVANNAAIDWINNRVVVISFRENCSGLKVGNQEDLGKDDWVTISPELRTKYEQNKGEFTASKSLRVKQLLGLGPKNKHKCFVKMTVDSKSLWRPSFNNSVEDCVISLIPSKIDEEYKQYLGYFQNWLNNGYPFTALGYTCDWKEGKCNYGLSEFVFKPQSKGEIIEVFKSVDDYLK